MPTFRRSASAKWNVARAGRTVVLVSHQLNQIRRLCHRVVWVDGGMVRNVGNTHEVVSAYESAMAHGDQNTAQKHRGPATKGRFLKWEIAQPRSDDPHTLTHLGPTTIKFCVEIHEPLRKAVHGIALFNHDRQLIWGWATRRWISLPATTSFVTHFPCSRFVRDLIIG